MSDDPHEEARIARLIAESFPGPMTPEQIGYLREHAPIPPWRPRTARVPADTTTGRLTQLARLRSVLWALWLEGLRREATLPPEGR